MILDLANINGNAIPPGRMMGQWRKESKLEWPKVPKPPPKAWEIFRRIMVKAFGTLSRVYNLCAEVSLVTKLGQWLANERHREHNIVRDRNNIYVSGAKGWRQFQRSGKEGQYKDSENVLVKLRMVILVMGKLKGSGYIHTINTT